MGIDMGPSFQQNNSANSNICRFLSRESIGSYSVVLNFILIILIIIISIVLGTQRCERQSHVLVPPTPCSCPSDWHLFKGICYYFSTEERNWTSSQDFCSSHNASLATIENEEKDFVMRHRPCKELYWIGLTRRSGEPWKWQNGQNATLKVLGEGENCAYLSDEEEAKASISRCSTERPWICSRSFTATGT